MTPRSIACRLAILGIALVASMPAFAQTSGTQAPPQASPSSQAASPQPAAAQTAPSQPAPTQGAPSQTAPAPAYSGPAYDIEIVVFRTKVALGQPENWAAETPASAATVAGGEASSGSGPAGRLLTVLPASDYRLAAIEARLRTSGTYQPVAHAAWVQTASTWGTRDGFPLESLGINVPGLTGVVFLERGEFLHLGMTLNYTMQDPPTGLNAPPGTTFVMNETRRVRFYQRNYYDHPAFGVIALITPARGPRPPGR
ncbi:MAG: CsiV family protein [Steroidobacteraceae bacterium]